MGEIGPRLGMNTNDNGFLRFDNFRIPRANMLMKNSQVLKVKKYYPFFEYIFYKSCNFILVNVLIH